MELSKQWSIISRRNSNKTGIIIYCWLLMIATLANDPLIEVKINLLWCLYTVALQFDLVCDRKILGSYLLTSYFFGALFGNFIWGYFADRYGRWNSHTLCHVGNLIFGTASLFSPTIYWLILFRFLTSLTATGYYVLNTIREFGDWIVDQIICWW